MLPPLFSHGPVGSTGVCTAGYRCPAGSLVPTVSACGIGSYSLAGAAACSQCPAGRFGNTTALTTPDCSGPCAPGYYGSTTGMGYPTCQAACSAGFYCPAGTVTMTANRCPRGQYSTLGAAACTNCPPGVYSASDAMPSSTCTAPCDPGYYGATAGATSSTCDGPCDAGYACSSGAMVSNQTVCAPGSYSVGGAAACLPCAAGSYSGSVARPGPCTDACPPGTYCPAGSNGTTDCPSGVYGNGSGLATSACAGVCPAGYYCAVATVNPQPCAAGSVALAVAVSEYVVVLPICWSGWLVVVRGQRRDGRVVAVMWGVRSIRQPDRPCVTKLHRAVLGWVLLPASVDVGDPSAVRQRVSVSDVHIRQVHRVR